MTGTDRAGRLAQTGEPAQGHNPDGSIAHRASRDEFLSDCLGKMLTIVIAIADTIGHDRAVDALLRLKAEHIRRAR